jgi:mono/diheme cytochrome c family protein
MSKGRLSLFVVLFLILLILTACGPDEEEFIQEGEMAYISNCGRCHMSNGEGFSHIYPPLAGNPVVTLEDPNPTIDVVVFGRGSMPGFGDQLDNEQIAQIISYIRNSWGNEAPVVTPERVRSGQDPD